jgi:uncharacterized protein YdiU (UPF0061 family)
LNEPAAQAPGLAFAHGYGQLPAHFYARVDPTRVAAPRLIAFNTALAAELALDVQELDEETVAAVFSGNRVVPGSTPIAMAYAGHQFGQFVPQLGDGRAILLGEVRDRAGVRREIQLKGSGRTPYSRSGDGRAALGPVLREYLVSEAMHALGIPATRALAAVVTGEAVFREQGALPGAILTRVAASHVRVGTFQYFAARGDTVAIKQLADYVLERLYPDAATAERPYIELLRAVVRAQARLIAAWMNVGFIHGVMNTDNMAVSGETIDFGPCAFMDGYDAAQVFSSIDRRGRYAYANQPAAAQWNLARFAETLLPLIDSQVDSAVEQATAVLAEFTPRFDAHWLAGMRSKLGLCTAEDGDAALIRALLDAMQREHADFTLTFRGLCDAADSAADAAVESLFVQEPAAFRQWALAWRARLAREAQPGNSPAARMRLANPAVIPRNHRIEAVIVAAVERGDTAPFAAMLRVLARPYEDQPEAAEFALPPRPEERVLQTFCGT